MNPLNQLLSQDPQAKSCFLMLGEQEQGLLIQHSDSVRSCADLMQLIQHRHTNEQRM